MYLPVNPFCFGDDDPESFLGVEYVAILIVNLGVKPSEFETVANIIFNQGGGA